MDSHTFKVGDRVKTFGPWPAEKGTHGTVESFNDWWVIVRMEGSGVTRPFMEGELSHAHTG
jgi:hypothetical protein